MDNNYVPNTLAITIGHNIRILPIKKQPQISFPFEPCLSEKVVPSWDRASVTLEMAIRRS